jgi:hypothetical protein
VTLQCSVALLSIMSALRSYDPTIPNRSWRTGALDVDQQELLGMWRKVVKEQVEKKSVICSNTDLYGGIGMPSTMISIVT